MVFIAFATVWPRISEWLFDAKRTVGPTFYNAIVPYGALLLLLLMGAAPLLGWRKTSKELFYKSFRFPLGVTAAVALIHLVLGTRYGYPAFVESDAVFPGAMGRAMAVVQGKLPLVTVALATFNIAVVVQEFYGGATSRQLKQRESFFKAIFNLLTKSRRRYGGYIVHVGIAVMFLGFAGRSWGTDSEASLKPNETMQIGDYQLTYKGPRMEVDHEKRMIFADVDVTYRGKPAGSMHPAKYIYKASPESPSTEGATISRLSEDLYVIIGMVNPTSKVASFQTHINPLVSLVWIGVIILILGAFVCMWPDPTPQESRVLGYVRALGSVTVAVVFGVVLAFAPSIAMGQQQDMKRVGIVEQTKEERALFKRLLCDCGSCPHEPLDTCSCGWAHSTRDELRQQLKEGKTPDEIYAAYAATYGEDAVVIRATEGADQTIWVLPLALSLVGASVLFLGVRGWLRRSEDELAAESTRKPSDGDNVDGEDGDGDNVDGEDGDGDGDEEPVASAPRDEYDDMLDDELRDLDE